MTGDLDYSELNSSSWPDLDDYEREEYCPYGSTRSEMARYDVIGFWLEAVALVILGVFGIVGNCVAIPVLVSARIASLFNKTLAVLAACDTVYLACDILESVRQYMGCTVAHMYAFPYLLYPLQNIAMVASIYTTVVLALERYLAVSRPLDMYIRGSGTGTGPDSGWKKVALYTAPVLIFAVLFNLPTFFEFKVVYQKVEEGIVSANDSNSSSPSAEPLRPALGITDLRLDEQYNLYYINLTRIPLTGLIPLGLLCVFNYLVYRHLASRRATVASMATGQFTSQMTLETRQTQTMFGVAALFVTGHLLRVVLNLHELFTINLVQETSKEEEAAAEQFDYDDEYYDLYSDCVHMWPFWTMVAKSVSRLLLNFSCSANLLVYCAASATFRKVLAEQLKALCQSAKAKQEARARRAAQVSLYCSRADSYYQTRRLSRGGLTQITQI